MDSQVWKHAFNKQKTLLWAMWNLAKVLWQLDWKANPQLCVKGPPLDKRTWAYSTRRTQKTLCWCGGGGGEQHRYPQQPIFSEVNYSNVPAPPPRSHQHSLSALITTIAGSISPHMCKHCSSAHLCCLCLQALFSQLSTNHKWESWFLYCVYLYWTSLDILS